MVLVVWSVADEDEAAVLELVSDVSVSGSWHMNSGWSLVAIWFFS